MNRISMYIEMMVGLLIPKQPQQFVNPLLTKDSQPYLDAPVQDTIRHSLIVKQTFSAFPALAVLAFSLFALPMLKAAEPSIDFNRDVRPILSDKCYQCHGPDADNQKSDFRLDSREEALRDLGGYFGIVPGNVEESDVHWRIWDDVEEDVMPPPDSKLSLSEAEKNVLDRWIAEGAPYDQHWAFKPIERPKLPKLSRANRKWAVNEIDAFVADRLKAEGLKPSPMADKSALIRRASLDLTGLPPTVEEVESFLRDDSPDAWERVVDRLLASPHYGERMALVWLDAARYADSGGYQNDIKRTQWPWRDWVIQAYNDNMPFDQFTIEQLAGDMLPNATDSQRLATAFNRNHRINNEGGIIPEEYLVEYVADRVETTSTVWLGLTMGCVRCHEHKYDPIAQKEYYELFAFFNNIPENGRDGNLAPAPNMTVYRGGTQKEHQTLREAVATAKSELRNLPVVGKDRFADWLRETSASREEKLEALKGIPEPSMHFPFDSVANFKSVDVRNPDRPAELRGRRNNLDLVDDAVFGGALKFGRAGFVKVAAPHGEQFDSSQPRSWIVQVRSPRAFAGSEGPVLVAAEEGTQRGYRLMLENADNPKYFRFSFQLMDSRSEGRGIEVVSKAIVPKNDWARLGVSWDGSGAAAGMQLYMNGEPVEGVVKMDSLSGSVTTDLPLLIGARNESDAQEMLRDATLLNGLIDDVQIYDRALSSTQMKALSLADPSDLMRARMNDAARDVLQVAWLKEDPEGQRLEREVKRKEVALNAFESRSVVEVSIMEEMDKPRETYRLERGAYDQPDKSEPVKPDTLDCLPPMDPSLPRDRLGLAQWLVAPENPLTARVAVNRYWQMYFGTGLVKTSEDFGSQGEPPSHPKLLDWLASAFIADGWNVKAMQKRLVMSATYRQSARVAPDALEKDPDNRLLARGPRFRLYGQALRDQALAVSGLLAPKIGGPPVMPYQPEGLWEEVNAKGYKYVVGKGEDLYRRSLYTFWRRTVPPPSMMNFDNSSREICSVRSGRTNTPLQAMNLMNDPQFVEAARALAELMILEGGTSTGERIAFGHRATLARDPEKPVVAILERGYEDYLDTFKRQPERARELVRSGAMKPRSDVDPVELAAMTTVANVLLNLDETLTKE